MGVAVLKALHSDPASETGFVMFHKVGRLLHESIYFTRGILLFEVYFLEFRSNMIALLPVVLNFLVKGSTLVEGGGETD